MSSEGLIGETSPERTHTLTPQGNSRHVDRDEFCMLLTCRRKLIRANDRRAGVWGLLDPLTGERFLIEEERLFTR
jgi:hypothetical protein